MTNSTDKVADATYAETGGSNELRRNQRRGFVPKAKAHFRRFWWAHLISFIFFTLLIALLLVYVAFPRIAQKGVNQSTLEFKTLKLTDPTPTSFHLYQDQVLHSTSQYHPTLDAFNASLFLESTLPDIKPFAYVQVPQTQALTDFPITIDQTIQIADVAQFAAYSKLVLNSESYRLAIRGRPVLHEGRYPAITVDYNQVVEMKGLNGLKGFEVTKFQVLLAPDKDGANMIGKVKIPNPSIMTIEMGNVTLDLSVGGDFIGTSLIQDLVLKPGDNELDMRSTTNQTMVISKLATFKDGILPVDVTGNSSIFNGEHLTYYEEALKSNKQRISLNVGAALKNGGTYP